MMNSFFQLLWQRIMNIGKIPLCNGLASRAPHFFGICFPLCYRCLFIVLGCFITLIICYRKKVKISLWIILLCVIPMIFDGGIQTFFGIISTNVRRSITGGLFGFGIGAFLSKLYMYLDKKG